MNYNQESTSTVRYRMNHKTDRKEITQLLSAKDEQTGWEGAKYRVSPSWGWWGRGRPLRSLTGLARSKW